MAVRNCISLLHMYHKALRPYKTFMKKPKHKKFYHERSYKVEPMQEVVSLRLIASTIFNYQNRLKIKKMRDHSRYLSKSC
jgi:hypothetical protein